MDSGLWYIFSIYTAAQEQSHRPVHSPLFPPRLSPVPCLLKNMEGKCQVCHFSLSHPLSSFFPPSGSVLPLPVRLSFTVLTFSFWFSSQICSYVFFCIAFYFGLNYPSSVFISLNPPVLIFFLAQVQFVLLLFIAGLFFFPPHFIPVGFTLSRFRFLLIHF